MEKPRKQESGFLRELAEAKRQVQKANPRTETTPAVISKSRIAATWEGETWMSLFKPTAAMISAIAGH